MINFWKEGLIKLPEKVTWFPGHMYRGMKLVQENISKIDIFIEVRDARIPLSSKNHDMDRVISKNQKQKIIIFNKFDLCNQKLTMQKIKEYNKVGISCMAVSATIGTNFQKLLDLCQEKNPTKYETVGHWMMVGGMPNVGKSTLLNQLRNRIAVDKNSRKKIVKSTPLPCTTKSVNGFKINDTPLLYLVDTPGICVPRIESDEVALKLSLTGCIKDSIAGQDAVIQYMLYALNSQKVLQYVKFYDLNGPVENVEDLIMHVRTKYFQFQYSTTQDMILKHFREGKLGCITLDNLDLVEENIN